jgi:2-iminobutanoate/2-iminopropanoate deaminase
VAAERIRKRHGLEIEELFGYWQALKVGDFVYISGQIGRDETGNPIPEKGLVPKFEKTMENMQAALEGVGSSLDNVVSIQVNVMKDLEECWETLSELHRRYFGKARPASTIVQIDNLNNPEYLVEVSAIAVTG